MTTFFEFEADFVDSLRCIPMQVRLKLDTCGIKLKLSHWHRFSQDQRAELVNLPCQSETEVKAYKIFLINLGSDISEQLTELQIDSNPAWEDIAHIPDQVSQQAASLGISITLCQWSGLSNLQRFALMKLVGSHHENHNFLPALQEFNLEVSRF